MTHERLVAMIRQATKDVFGTMLGIELEDHPEYLGVTAPGPSEGVLAIVGLAGAWAGSGSFSCSALMAQKISGQLLMQEYAAIDDEVLDAIGEVTNMVLGNVKTVLEEELGPMGLSIPTVIYGRNFTTRSVGKSQWTVVPFQCMGELVEVHLCLEPGKELSAKISVAQEQVPAILTMIG
ncbi:chemotaxis protein CheX [Paludibaculum fermentans]|uniref:chemotaxis protein CheX n=1 Tax=Paludibaculum fermentans TaxID=1473598 RepID=UPI003EB69F9D